MTRRKFQTSAELMLLSGLYLTRLPGPLSRPSNTGSTCKDETTCQHCCGPRCCGQHESLISRRGSVQLADIDVLPSSTSVDTE